MRKITCIIVDDEPLALDLIEEYVKKTPFLELIGKCSSPFQAMDQMQVQIPDLLFLDIQMPGLTGIDFYKSLQDGPRVIFTTAYSHYAVEGFKVDALDYLVKPFNYQEFLKAASKALNWFRLTDTQQNSPSVQLESEKVIFVKSEYKLLKVEYDKIVYIEGLKDYVKIFTTDRPKPILSLMTLKSLEEKLPSNQFMRVHRSYIVNLFQIKVIERSRIVFGSTYIPVADGYKEKFQEYLDNRFIG